LSPSAPSVASVKSSNKQKKRLQQQLAASPYRCIIDCGRFNDDGGRVFSEKSDFFGGAQVEIFTAEPDPRHLTLYRAAVLAQKYNWPTNKVSYHLFL